MANYVPIRVLFTVFIFYLRGARQRSGPFPHRLFYSRRIGLFQRQQVRIFGGARVVGRRGPWDVGLLNTQTARESGLRPGGGLELRDNYFRLGDRVGYGWIPGEASSIQRHRLNLEGEAYLRNAGGGLQSLEPGSE